MGLAGKPKKQKNGNSSAEEGIGGFPPPKPDPRFMSTAELKELLRKQEKEALTQPQNGISEYIKFTDSCWRSTGGRTLMFLLVILFFCLLVTGILFSYSGRIQDDNKSLL